MLKQIPSWKILFVEQIFTENIFGVSKLNLLINNYFKNVQVQKIVSAKMPFHQFPSWRL